jgi:hypothetical protein
VVTAGPAQHNALQVHVASIQIHGTLNASQAIAHLVLEQRPRPGQEPRRPRLALADRPQPVSLQVAGSLLG